jgi:hypothetical protein
MKKQYLLIILLAFFFISCDRGKELSPCEEISREYKKDLMNLIPEGVHKVNIQTIKQTKELVQLQKTYKESIQSNYEWFLEYMNSNVILGQGLSYHENFGLTETEYQRMGDLLKNLRYEDVVSETINVSYDSNMIKMTGSGLLKMYGVITINLDTNQAKIGVHFLDKLEQINVTESDNALGSSWSGYTWKQEPENIELKDINDAIKFTANQFKLTIARINNTGNRYLSLSIKMFENGEEKINTSNTIVF